MNQGLIPHRYAKALYAAGVEQGKTEKIYDIMKCLSDAFEAASELQTAMANPFIDTMTKVTLLERAVDKEVDPLYTDFVKLLSRRGRLPMARDIAYAYEDLYREENRIFKVQIESAAALSVPLQQRMTDVIKKHIGNGTPECTFKVNPDLVGGFKIRLGNELLDASVATQLNHIRLELTK